MGGPYGKRRGFAYCLLHLSAMTASALQETVPFDQRQAEAGRILKKYPDRIPVICEKAPNSTLPDIDKKKFLVPGTMLVGEFKYIVHKHLKQKPECDVTADQTIYLYINRISPNTAAQLSEVY